MWDNLEDHVRILLHYIMYEDIIKKTKPMFSKKIFIIKMSIISFVVTV